MCKCGGPSTAWIGRWRAHNKKKIAKWPIPLYHRFVLGRLHTGYLSKIDIKIRAFIRGVLHLPHDFPNPVFYTSVKDGGLGIPCMRYSIPVMAHSRLGDNSARTAQLCTLDGVTIKNRNKFLRLMKNKLYQSVDGSGLRQAARVPSAHYWVSDGTSFLSGKDFISSIHLRFNCLPTQARLARSAGRTRQKSCRRCGEPAETIIYCKIVM